MDLAQASAAYPMTAGPAVSAATQDQGEISGLSRSVSNLGSSLGTALVGSVLVAVKLPEGRPFAIALTMMLVIALIGLVIAVLIPRQQVEATPPRSSQVTSGPETLGGEVA